MQDSSSALPKGETEGDLLAYLFDCVFSGYILNSQDYREAYYYTFTIFSLAKRNKICNFASDI